LTKALTFEYDSPLYNERKGAQKNMKVIVSQSELASLSRKLQSIVPSKPSIPTLLNILIEAVNGELILSATDLSISIQAHIGAEILEEGSIALPAKKFIPLISELSAPLVEIHSTGSSATIHSGTSKFKMQGISKQEYPEIADLDETTKISLPALTLKELLAKTVFASGKDEARPLLNSVFLECNDSDAAFTGTDGKRLAKSKTKLKDLADLKGSFILPTKTVDEMIRLLDTKEEEISLTLADDTLSLRTGSTTLISKLLSGQYPDVSRIIPSDKSNPISLHREELITLLRQISLFTMDNSASVKFTFTPGNLQLSAASGSIGEGNVNMPVNYQGETLEIAFNPNYFLDILRHSKDETVTFNIENAHNPGLITDSSDTLFVLMPMRLGA
jgi:DNA polymerase III subunit beta